MRIPQLLLGLVVASALLLAAAAWLPEGPGMRPTAHPEYPSLLSGADARPDALLAIGWAFGAVQLAFFAACFALGMRRSEGLGPLRRPLWLGWVLYELVWVALVASYAAWVREPGAPLWGGFPRPTAWMLFGMWPFPLFFAWLYLRHFDGWVLTEGDLERYRARLAELESGDPGPGA